MTSVSGEVEEQWSGYHPGQVSSLTHHSLTHHILTPLTVVVWRCFSQCVVFLYLMDEKTSLLVIVPAGIAAVIEVGQSDSHCL